MPGQAVLVAGGTGLVGEFLLQGLRGDADVVALVRGGAQVPAERVLAVNFETLVSEGAAALGEIGPVRVGVSCLGTTMAKAGGRAAFARVDHDYVLALARLAGDLGARHFILVSSVGADAASSNYYLAVKGRVERALATLAFDRLDILRPGLLLGPRAERRSGERLGQLAAPALNPLLFGALHKYRAIEAATVAAAIAALVRQPSGSAGLRIHHNRDIAALAIT